MADDNLTNSIEKGYKEIRDRLNDPRIFLDDISNSIGRIHEEALQINNAFGETRNRIYELKTGFADAIPRVERLGGTIQDVSNTITEISQGSNRNIVATEKQISSLYAAFRVTGQSVRELVKGFNDVGVGINMMSKNIEDSLKYIRSIGLNTREVFSVVTDNMDQLNRYQFENGIVGLTKMAAQAHSLRFSMSDVTRFADNLYRPEKAIEAAAAFQRLGLAVGDLGDPFRLMNASLTNPKGLQDNLIKVAQQFVSFNDKTKSFDISQDGILRFKEIADITGISAEKMVKLGKAAAEADRRLSQIKSFTGFNISEEDNQLLSNISRINDRGNVEIFVKDANGDRSYKELTEISKRNLEEIIKEQKENPNETLEEIQRSQLRFDERIAGDVRAIYHGFIYGFGSSNIFSEGLEAVGRITNTVFGDLSDKLASTKGGRKLVSNINQDVKELRNDIKSGKSQQMAVGDFVEKLGLELENQGGELKEALKESFKSMYANLTTKTELESYLKTELGSFLKGNGVDLRTIPVGGGSSTQNLYKNQTNNQTNNQNNGQTNNQNNNQRSYNKTNIVQNKEDTTKFENFSKSIETAFIGNLENIKKTNKGADQGEINKVENNLKEDIKSLVKAFEKQRDVNFNELFEKIKKENIDSPEYVKESLKKSYEEFYKTLKSNNNTEVEKKFLEQYEEFIKKNNGGIVSNTNTTTNQYIKGPDNKQQGNDNFDKVKFTSIYDALLVGTKNISGKQEENKGVANNYSKGAKPVALGGKDKKDDNTIYQKIDQNIKIDYAFSPIEVKISGDNGKLDATKVQTMINTSLNDALSKFSKDMINSLKDDNLKQAIAGAPNYGKTYNTAV